MYVCTCTDCDNVAIITIKCAYAHFYYTWMSGRLASVKDQVSQKLRRAWCYSVVKQDITICIHEITYVLYTQKDHSSPARMFTSNFTLIWDVMDATNRRWRIYGRKSKFIDNVIPAKRRCFVKYPALPIPLCKVTQKYVRYASSKKWCCCLECIPYIGLWRNCGAVQIGRLLSKIQMKA